METLQLLADNLNKQGYHVECFENKEAATEYLANKIQGTTIGIGGSQTVHQMDLYKALIKNNKVFWHDEKPEDMTIMETRQAAFSWC